MVLQEPHPIFMPALALSGLNSTGRKRVQNRAPPGARQGTHKYRHTPPKPKLVKFFTSHFRQLSEYIIDYGESPGAKYP